MGHGTQYSRGTRHCCVPTIAIYFLKYLLVVENLFVDKTSFLDWNRWGRAKWPLFSILGSGVVFTYLILTSSLEASAIALAFSPSNTSTQLPTPEFVVGLETPNRLLHWDFKISDLGDRSNPNPAPDSASIGSSDRIYLYGQSPKPDQIKQEYFVFEVRQGKVVGAFYLPRSAFYCFYGNLERNQLNLTVVDTYDGTTSPYSVNLQQYHQIPIVSDNDRRILGICKRAHQEEVWGK